MSVPGVMAATFASEKSPELNLSVDKTELTIGEILLLKLELTHAVSEKPTVPFSKKSLGEWTIRRIEGPVTQEIDPGQISEVWECHLSVYRTGEITIPPIEVGLVNAAGKRRVLATDPITVKVRSILSQDEDHLKEIKRQAEIAPDYKPFLMFVAVVVAVALLLAKLILALRKRGKHKPKKTVAPAPPPEQLAREAIKTLLARKLIEQGQIKQFYLELSEIVKRYLGISLDILSLERTTEEFVRDLVRSPVCREHCREIHQFLSDCDSVKFAKYIPSPEEIQRVVERSFEIIDKVKAPTIEENNPLEVAV